MTLETYRLACSQLQGRLIAPYQRDGVLWMLHRELTPEPIKGGFLCDEMGLGKTVQLIATMLGNPRLRTLIVVPKSVVNQWSQEIAKFAPNLSVLVHDGINRTADVSQIEKFNVVICPYSLMTPRFSSDRHDTILHRVNWNRVILDEAHEIRNPKSKLTQSIMSLKSPIRWIVTGTPVFNSMRDFVTLCEFLGLHKSVVQGMTSRIRERYVLRRTKDDVAEFNIRLKLPDCVFENVYLDMYPEESDEYEKVFGKAQESIRDIMAVSNGNLGMHSMAILEFFLRCRQVMVLPQLVVDKSHEDAGVWRHPTCKMDTLFKCMDEHRDEKSLIFCQFIGEMDFIQQSLINQGVKVFRLDGSVSNDNRNTQVNEFKACKVRCAFVIQIKAGGQGLNLQEATRVYIMAPSWNPATELQAIGRSHRTGQTKQVYIKKFVYNDVSEDLPSIEQALICLQGAKSEICSEVLNDIRLREQVPKNLHGAQITLKEIVKIFVF